MINSPSTPFSLTRTGCNTPWLVIEADSSANACSSKYLRGCSGSGCTVWTVTILLVTVTPWMVVMTIGHVVRRGKYFTLDLQSFAIPDSEKRGVYWFWHGVNPRAFLAWGAGTAVGLLFAETSIYTGPLPTHVHNVDLSFTSAWIVAGVVYLLLIRLFPERDVAPVDGEPLPAAALGLAE